MKFLNYIHVSTYLQLCDIDSSKFKFSIYHLLFGSPKLFIFIFATKLMFLRHLYLNFFTLLPLGIHLLSIFTSYSSLPNQLCFSSPSSSLLYFLLRSISLIMSSLIYVYFSINKLLCILLPNLFPASVYSILLL